MKIRGIAFFLTVLLIMLLCSCSQRSAVGNDIILLQEKSWFNDFSVRNNTVYMECYLTVDNLKDEDVTVKISAASQEDVAGGLLKSARLTGLDESLSSDTFSLSGGENCITVIFTGESGGKLQKQDKLLPENIKFEIVE